MKKIINNPENFVDETMEGIVLAYGDAKTFPTAHPSSSPCPT